MRAGSGWTGSPNPPASSAGANPRGSSSNANGFPRVSAMIRSRTRSSSGQRITEASSARASPSPRPSTTSSGKPARACSAPDWRTANTRPTESANSRRATNSSACSDARSSHCASSTRHTSGRSSATSDSRPSTARPTRKRSGATPVVNPNAVPNASRCGGGRRSRRSSIDAHSCCSPAKASSISDCTPPARATRHPDACSTRCSSKADLPTPGSPRTTRTRLSPWRTASSSRSSTSRSLRRSSNISHHRRGGDATSPPLEKAVLAIDWAPTVHRTKPPRRLDPPRPAKGLATWRMRGRSGGMRLRTGSPTGTAFHDRHRRLRWQTLRHRTATSAA